MTLLGVMAQPLWQSGRRIPDSSLLDLANPLLEVLGSLYSTVQYIRSMLFNAVRSWGSPSNSGTMLPNFVINWAL